jgi:DNA (cytosine-5)-methyltransferase 1
MPLRTFPNGGRRGRPESESLLSHKNLTSGQAAEPSSGTHHATEKPGAAQSAISLHASREQPPAPGRSDHLTKPRILDLFCGAGGAAEGYHRAGFAVTGIDIKPQPDYPYEFIQSDVMEWLSRRSGFLRFDAIHASPPCQAFSAMTQVAGTRDNHPDLLTPIRDWLHRIGLPYVIENVPGAPVYGHVTLCGTAFGLGAGEYELRRHRHFETSFPVMVPPCQHRKPTLGIYGDHARDRRRVEGENPDRGRQFPAGVGLELAREAMEMPWANWRGLSQAIPPAFTEYLGHYLLSHVQPERIAA